MSDNSAGDEAGRILDQQAVDELLRSVSFVAGGLEEWRECPRCRDRSLAKYGKDGYRCAVCGTAFDRATIEDTKA